MLTRRRMLLNTAAFSAAFGIAASPTFAFSTEPMSAADAAALAAGCGAAGHAALIAKARSFFGGEAAGYDATVFCPLCHCSLQVTPAPAL